MLGAHLQAVAYVIALQMVQGPQGRVAGLAEQLLKIDGDDGKAPPEWVVQVMCGHDAGQWRSSVGTKQVNAQLTAL